VAACAFGVKKLFPGFVGREVFSGNGIGLGLGFRRRAGIKHLQKKQKKQRSKKHPAKLRACMFLGLVCGIQTNILTKKAKLRTPDLSQNKQCQFKR
jgi:hypothetical protein